MFPEIVFFDLDGTLYPARNGLWRAIKHRITRFLIERMKYSSEEAQRIRQEYLARYGTTLKGLQVEHGIDHQEYLTYVHDLPLNEFLQPDKQIRTMLEQIQLPKWIFTNSDRNHVDRVLKILELENLFDGIIDIYALGFFCKPDEKAYHNALKIARVEATENSILIDDLFENIRSAVKLGFRTVHVFDPGDMQVSADQQAGYLKADYVIRDLICLPEVLPQLLVNQPMRYC